VRREPLPGGGRSQFPGGRLASPRRRCPSINRSALADIRDLIDRVTVSRTAIQVQLSEGVEAEADARTLTFAWTLPSPYRKREIIQGASNANTSARPIRANARAVLIDALREAHRWLDELMSDPRQTLESLALREDKTDRSIRMTLSLAFLAPASSRPQSRAVCEGTRRPRMTYETRSSAPQSARSGSKLF
jgi:hypothetical protein